MKRQTALQALASHAWMGRLYSKMKPADLQLMNEFIAKNDHLSKGDFELAINRMFIDKAEKPKRWSSIMEILTVANSSTK